VIFDGVTKQRSGHMANLIYRSHTYGFARNKRIMLKQRYVIGIPFPDDRLPLVFSLHPGVG